jgi:group I intron endonuclease
MINSNYGVIYIGTNRINGKCYIGQTIDPKPSNRWLKGHFKAENDWPLYRAMKKYGKNVFTFEVIWHCTNQAELDQSENSFMDLFDTIVPNGYNVRRAGRRGKHHEISKAKMRAAQATPEAKARKSAAMKVMHTNPENKERHRQGLIAAWAKEGESEKRGIAISKALREPEKNKRLRIALRKAYTDPELRNKLSEKVKKTYTDPVLRLRIGEMVKAANKRDPDIQVRRIIGIKAAWNLPGVRKIRGNISKECMSNPSTREKHHNSLVRVLNQPEMKERLSKVRKELRWINNGKENRRIRLNIDLPEGWVFGRINFRIRDK